MSETKNAKIVIENGALDIGKSAILAKKKVKRHNGMPVHACGLQSHRDCPCWTCTTGRCQACMASAF